MKDEKHVIIQKKINEVMQKEFENLIKESSEDPLLKLILSNEIEYMTLDKIKEYLEM